MKARNKWVMGALAAAVVSQSFVAPAVASTSSEIEATAKTYTGTPYVWGGASSNGFDCSGFIQHVFQQHGINLPRTTAQQFYVGTSVSKVNLQKGDLVFFETYKKGPSHVGIYLEGGQFINASSSKGVSMASINSSYWSERYLGAKRVLPGQQAKPKVESSSHTANVNKQSTKPNTQQKENATRATGESEADTEEDVMRVNDDGKTYTVQTGDTLIEIASNFNLPLKKLKLLNEKENNLIHEDDQIIIKGEPNLKVTLFEEVTKEDQSQEFVPLPVKGFEKTEQQKLMFEQKQMTKAELAISIKYFVENNPSSIHLLKDYEKKADIKDVSDEYWANNSIEWAVSNEFMKLDKNGEFHPDEEVKVEDTDLIFDTLHKHHNLSKSDVEYLQEQMDVNEDWSYNYMERLIYKISFDLASNEDKIEEVLEEQTDEQEISPSLSMAKERVGLVTTNMLKKVANVPLINQNVNSIE
ncbi:C40 family peptidase [Virgibacillus halodenitrificans]|uniref:C40 family peptidase n=1 Tax=Virgibacillus halodenitrificans TaxID=1482 RepID=UPI000EF4D014|nr:C40 family peptidase [Virgibacillus halodenitrificans]